MSPLEAQFVETVDAVLGVATDMERPDVREHVGRIKTWFLNRETRVLVIGDFKVGKSTLVNALVNADVCPVDDDVATAVPTVVFYGDEPAAAWWRIRSR